MESNWVASLSDGSTRTEKEYAKLNSGLSPWQTLKLECDTSEHLFLTQIRRVVRTNAGQVQLVGMRGAKGFLVANKVVRHQVSGKSKMFLGLGSVIGDHVMMVWVNDDGIVWQEIMLYKDVDVHTIKAVS